MNMSQMKDRITFLSPPNDDGINLDPPYNPYCTVWAKVEYFSSKEIYSANAINILNSIKFIIRYRTDIRHDMRIKLENGDVYEITGIRPLDDKKMYLLIVSEMIKHE